jgi:hypothetical protein
MTARADAEQWLADHRIEMTAAPLKRFAQVWTDLAGRYPDARDTTVRDAALLAAARYLGGYLTPADIGKTLARARAKADETMAAARQVAVMAVDDGAAEAVTARDVGVDRMALRKWLGKR